MSWSAIFVAFAVSHLGGDFILQTDWQARNKHGGLWGSREATRALTSHVATYTLAFVPALIWIGTEIGVWAVAIAALIAVPHFVQDDGRLLRDYMRKVKKVPGEPGGMLYLGVDQSFHAAFLLGAALVAAALR